MKTLKKIGSGTLALGGIAALTILAGIIVKLVWLGFMVGFNLIG